MQLNVQLAQEMRESGTFSFASAWTSPSGQAWRAITRSALSLVVSNLES
jgi:hypothetical protein